MTANVDAMVRAGVEAFRAGKKPEARKLLERAIELDSYNEMAWLWLSAVVDSPEEQQTCLENVITINPKNDRARQGLRSLGIDPDKVGSAAAASSAPAFESGTFDDFSFDDNSGASGDVFSDVDFSADNAAFDIDDNLFSDDPYGTAQDDYIDDSLFDAPADEMYADINTYEEFTGNLDGGDYDESLFDDDPLAPEPAYDDFEVEEFSSPAPRPSAGLLAFREIPPEIPVGRMPGTSESVPSIHYVIVGVLALVNLGAVAFIVMQFVG